MFKIEKVARMPEVAVDERHEHESTCPYCGKGAVKKTPIHDLKVCQDCQRAFK